jgi:hypothetical protein
MEVEIPKHFGAYICQCALNAEHGVVGLNIYPPGYQSGFETIPHDFPNFSFLNLLE